MISKAARYCIILLFCLPLAGCFKSDVALIDKSNAAWPFKRASLLLKGEDQSWTYSLQLGTQSYMLSNLREEEKAMKDGTIFFYKVQDGLFVMQWQYGAGSKYDLFIVRMDGDRFMLDTCGAYRSETLTQLNLQRDLGDCWVTNLGQLVRLAQMAPDVQGRKPVGGELSILEK